MTTIETLTGDVNLRTGSAKCFVFHAPRVGHAGHGENHLGIAAKTPATASVVRTVSPYPIVIPSVQFFSTEIGGKMVRMTYSVEDGEILKIYAQRRPGDHTINVHACQFLRVRETAALRSVEVKLLTDPSICEPAALIRGRFDLISLEEARSLGVKVAESYERFFLAGSVGHLMTVGTLAPENAQAKIVQTKTGQPAVVVTEVKRRRKITLE